MTIIPEGQERLAREIAGRLRDYIDVRHKMLNLKGDSNVIHSSRGATSFTERNLPIVDLLASDIKQVIDLLDPPEMEDRYDKFAEREHAIERRHSDDGGVETHPSWGMAVINTFTSTGSHFFDSEITHQHGVSLRIMRATRQRQVKRDYLHAADQLIEVVMSAAQWGSLVSASGNGNGVPVTIHSIGGRTIAPAPYDPRLGLSVATVREAADKSIAEIDAAFKAMRAAQRKEDGAPKLSDAISRLETAIRNGPANMEYAAKTLNEHVENVISKAQADIEAMVEDAVDRRGIDRTALPLIELTAGEATDA